MTLPVNPLGGTGTPVVTQPPLEGGPLNQNVDTTFNIAIHGGSQPVIDYHQDAFFIPKADSVYDAFGPSTVEMEKKLCVLEEKMKVI